MRFHKTCGYVRVTKMFEDDTWWDVCERCGEVLGESD